MSRMRAGTTDSGITFRIAGKNANRKRSPKNGQMYQRGKPAIRMRLDVTIPHTTEVEAWPNSMTTDRMLSSCIPRWRSWSTYQAAMRTPSERRRGTFLWECLVSEFRSSPWGSYSYRRCFEFPIQVYSTPYASSTLPGRVPVTP